MSVKHALVAVVLSWSICSLAAAQQKTKDPNLLPMEVLSSEPQSPTQFFALEHVQTKDVLTLLVDLGFSQKAVITASPVPNQIIVRAPQKTLEEIGHLIMNLEESAEESTIRKNMPTNVSFKLRVPPRSQLDWVGGQGGMTSSPFGILANLKAGSSTTFRITNIPGHERLVVEARIEVPLIDREIAAVMQSNLTLMVATLPELEELANGAELHKFITGPHDLTAGQTELFDEVVKRGDEILLEGSPETKGKNIVAIVHLVGVHGNTTKVAEVPATSIFGTTNVAEDLATTIFGVAKGSNLPGFSLTIPSVSSDGARSEINVASLLTKFTELEDRVASMAQLLRRMDGAETENATELRRQLVEAISESFNQRQQLQLAQIELQRAKLNALEKKIVHRSEIRPQLIQQRLTELLPNGNP